MSNSEVTNELTELQSYSLLIINAYKKPVKYTCLKYMTNITVTQHNSSDLKLNISASNIYMYIIFCICSRRQEGAWTDNVTEGNSWF